MLDGIMRFRSPGPLSAKCACGLALALLPMAGCSNAYPLDVVFIGRNVAFAAKKHSPRCLFYVKVASGSGEVMWQFNGPLQSPDCKSDFPLIYGKVPRGAQSPFPAKPIQPNVEYFVEATDGDWYLGSFRIRRVLKIESAPIHGEEGHLF